MQEIIGANDDILFDLEQIKLISQREVRLTGNQKDKVGRLPKKKQEQIKKEILAKKEQEKKTFLRIWTLELEEKVKRSGLPPEITSQILEMTSYAKDRNMTFIYDIERKIEALKEQVKEAERKKVEEAMEKDMAVIGAINTAVVGAVVAGAVLAPHVQVRYDKEEFEKRSETYMEEKVVPRLAMAAEKPIVPLEPVREYKKKQGSQYSESQVALDKKHNDEWMDILVQKTQAEQKAKGQKVQTYAEIVANFSKLSKMEQKTTINGLKRANQKLAARQEQETKANDKAVIEKGIARSLRKYREKEAKRAAALARKAARENGQTITQQKQSKGVRQAGDRQQPPIRPALDETIKDIPAGMKMAELKEIRNPQFVERLKREKEAVERAETEKGMERFKRKQKEKEAKAAKREKARENMREQIALKKARIQSKGPRIAEREKTEKPITITKEMEQQVAPPWRPVVTKEDEKQLGKVKDFAKTPERMAAREQAFREQVTENKGPERLYDKGFSKFLAVAQERVQSESRGLSAAEVERRRRIQEKINREAPNIFLQARKKYSKVA